MEFLIEPDAKGAGASTRLHFVSVIVDILETNVGARYSCAPLAIRKSGDPMANKLAKFLRSHFALKNREESLKMIFEFEGG